MFLNLEDQKQVGILGRERGKFVWTFFNASRFIISIYWGAYKCKVRISRLLLYIEE